MLHRKYPEGNNNKKIKNTQSSNAFAFKIFKYSRKNL